MISRLLEESLIVRFLKRLFFYAQNSYLFHFDFKVEMKAGKIKKEKPLGFFESVLVVLDRGFSKLSMAIAQMLEGSFIFRIKKGYLQALQKDSVSSVLYFLMGFLSLYALKTMNLKLVIAVCAVGLGVVFYPLVKRYYEGSMIFKCLNSIIKGGDAK